MKIVNTVTRDGCHNKFYCWNGADFDLHINMKNVETIKDDGDGMLEITFMSGTVRRIGPFSKNDIDEIMNYNNN